MWLTFVNKVSMLFTVACPYYMSYNMWLICVTKWLSPAIREKKERIIRVKLWDAQQFHCCEISFITFPQNCAISTCVITPLYTIVIWGLMLILFHTGVEIELAHFVCLWGNFWWACTTTQRWHKQTKHKRHHDSWLQNFNIDKRVEVIYTIVLQYVSSGGV